MNERAERVDCARQRIAEAELFEAESKKIVRDAANRILEVSSELHLTWDEFERAIATVKKKGHIT